jgi:hypothetical protein
LFLVLCRKQGSALSHFRRLIVFHARTFSTRRLLESTDEQKFIRPLSLSALIVPKVVVAVLAQSKAKTWALEFHLGNRAPEHIILKNY